MVTEEIRSFFLETILGIIVLGSIGSIAAAVVIWIGSKLLKWYVNGVGLSHALRVIFPYVRSLETSAELKRQLLEDGEKDFYRFCLYEKMIETLLSSSIAFVLLISTIFSFALLWPDQPKAIAILISATLYAAHSSLKSSIGYVVFIPDDLKGKVKSTHAKYKTFKDFEKSIDERVEGLREKLKNGEDK